MGQSQVKRDDAVSDTEFFVKNPELVEKSENVFNAALKELQAKNDPEAYEKACLIASEFTKEFAK